jgi:hypothetical protein
MTCSNGHDLMIGDVLNSAVIYDAVPCPSCREHGISPPYCFNRQNVLSTLGEDSYGMGHATCPKCMCHGLPSVRILDILNPEVFLSYQWGVTIPSLVAGDCYTTQVRFRV